MNYSQFNKTIQDKVNNFPMAFAFSKEQFEEVLTKLGVKDSSELYSIQSGGFIRKVDSEAFNNLFEEIDKEKVEFLSNPKNLKNALIYELRNHEYCYTWDCEPALEALGLEYDKLTDEQLKILKEAREICRNEEA